MNKSIKLNREILTNIISEAMTNLHNGYREETEPWNEVDGVESVQNEVDDNPLNKPTNNYYESKNIMKNKIKLTETQLRKIVKESVNQILKEESHDNLEYYSDYFDDYPFGDDYTIKREKYPEGIEGDNQYSWDLKDRRDLVSQMDRARGKDPKSMEQLDHFNHNIHGQEKWFRPSSMYARHGDNPWVMNQIENWR